MRSPLRTYDDARRRAKRRLPRAVFDYVEGAAGAEITARDNKDAFARVKFAPRSLVDVSERSTQVTVFGERLRTPILVAPTGLSRLCHRRCELIGARAAGAAGSVFVVSTTSTYAIEEITRVATGPIWFQLYLWRDRNAVAGLVRRVERAGCRALGLTVDVPLPGNRERDAKNGATLPPTLRPRSTADAIRHPRWTAGFLRSPRVWYGSLPNGVRPEVGIGDTSATWERLAWLRSIWSGPLVVKGIMTVDDALQAVACGADAIYVSNHGGRQLDTCQATLDVLPDIAVAVGDRAEVFFDGGVRRGADAVKARALGATVSFIGRPWVFALAAGGEPGVRQMLDSLTQDVDRTLALLGVPSFEAVGPGVLARPPNPATAVLTPISR